MYAKLVWDGQKLEVPCDMGCPKETQLKGSDLDNLCELAGRVCYDSETEVLTKDGWVSFPNLSKGIEVATYSNRNGEMEFQVPTEYISKTHKGQMYSVENTKVSLRVTHDHELWCLQNKTSSWKFIKAEDLLGKKYKVKRYAFYQGYKCESISLPEHTYTQPISNQYGNCGISTRTTKGLLICSEKILAWTRFLGYYFSEGCTNKYSKNHGRSVIIYQNVNNAQPIIDTVKELEFKFSTYLDKRNNVLRIMIGNAPIARYLEQFGKTSHDKTLPRECLEWNYSLRKELLDALMFGDGSLTKNNVRVYNTSSSRLADDVQELIIKSGRVGTISYSPVAKMYRVRESAHNLHTVNKHKTQDCLDNVEEKVYCVSVPNRILITRRNKKIVLCGNCYDSLGSGRDSVEYHKHITEVGHTSVDEHANITFAVALDITNYLSCVENLVNRPGIWMCKEVPLIAMPGKGGFILRLTLNLRAIREWFEFPPMNKMYAIMGNKIQLLAKEKAPLVLHALNPSDNDFPLQIVEPKYDEEKWVSVFFTNVSRGFSHELVRHKYRTAVSQRSTRYVDEGDSHWCWHPLILKNLNVDNEVILPDDGFNKNYCMRSLKEIQTLCQDGYRALVDRLQVKLIEEGSDKFTARKQARGAARGLLGNALNTELVFSASITQWKWMFGLRASAHADAEIRVVMNEVYEQFLERMPHHVQGYEKVSCPDNIGYGLKLNS